MKIDYDGYGTIYNGDCLEEHLNIGDGVVDLILTDLPYGTVKNIGGEDDKFKHGMKGKTNWDDVIDTKKIFEISERILRMNGKMILFSQQPFTTELINNQNSNVTFSYNMIWKKDHFANSLISKKSPVNYYEDILVFSKIYDSLNLHPLRNYFKDVLSYINKPKKEIIDAVGQPIDHCLRVDSTQFALCTEKTYVKFVECYSLYDLDGYKTFSELEKINSTFKSTFNLWEDNNVKSNILEYKKDYDGFHPTQKPVALTEDLIQTFSNVGDLVVDLTMGSGTTCVASINTNRKFIGIEQDKKYFNISKERIENSLQYLKLFDN